MPLREGDIESVERNLGDRSRRPGSQRLDRKGRVMIDKGGKRVIYDVSKDGKVRIKDYEE